AWQKALRKQCFERGLQEICAIEALKEYITNYGAPVKPIATAIANVVVGNQWSVDILNRLLATTCGGKINLDTRKIQN
ncbi:MAG: hypothetical protein HUK20_14750, partial [Fibrobacter sp.]|nr:hypothetical protein [Fibrobacter sp.]